MTSRNTILLATVLVCITSIPARNATASELRGSFVSETDKSPAVVWVEGLAKTPVPPTDTVITHSSGKFQPHVSIGFVGNNFVLRNEDNRLHNTHLSLRLAYQEMASQRPLHYGATLYNIALPSGGREVKRPIKPYHRYRDETGFIEVICNPHPEEQAFVLVFDHPFAAVTGDNGEFAIADIPSGKHEVRYWHAGAIKTWGMVEFKDGVPQEIVIKRE